MPKYAKFLKGLLSNKTRLEEACTVKLNERCSAVLLNKLPSKEKDPGSFTIPCDIGHLHINNALADLGASISLMPYTMYEKLGLREPKPTRMRLELADRSIQYPQGIAENILIKIDKFILRIDFVILDMREDSKILIILGRPFLAIARAMIDVFNKKITLRVGNEEESIDLSDLERCGKADDSGFFQIPITPEDQEKITFTCPYGTFAYRRMPFGLCNAPKTFQRCMTAIFYDMVEDFMEVFMDDSCKQDAKPRLIKWNLLLQGFNIEIKDQKGAENLVVDHLSRLKNLNIGELAEDEITDKFPDEH
ncbi:reverse transcriptase domain-containing protein [Tanacetum coccineum]|uniref:Reverse transcriptase domain-containing protein n=1 Tax=Tanacetum coccineum TaxID=301880 RepID=A0ABQ5E3C5_9ASTR